MADPGEGEVSSSQSQQNMADPQPEGEILAGPIESVSSGPSERERSQDDPPSLTRKKSQEERFDELKKFTPRRVNLLRRFTEISAKPEEGSQDQASSSSGSGSTEPFHDSPAAGKVCQTCKARPVEGIKKLRRCSGCSVVAYCDQECQRKDWLNHRKQCWVIPGQGYKPKKRLQSVEEQEDLGAPDEAGTPEKATAGTSSTPENSPALVRSIRSEVTQAPTSKQKSWRRRTLFGEDVDPLLASAGIRRKISFRDDIDDELNDGSDEKCEKVGSA